MKALQEALQDALQTGMLTSLYPCIKVLAGPVSKKNHRENARNPLFHQWIESGVCDLRMWCLLDAFFNEIIAVWRTHAPQQLHKLNSINSTLPFEHRCSLQSVFAVTQKSWQGSGFVPGTNSVTLPTDLSHTAEPTFSSRPLLGAWTAGAGVLNSLQGFANPGREFRSVGTQGNHHLDEEQLTAQPVKNNDLENLPRYF